MKHRLGLVGASGRVGVSLRKILESGFTYQDHTFEIAVEVTRRGQTLYTKTPPDIWIDFSEPEAILSLLPTLEAPLVTGTTGFSDDQFNKLKEHAKRYPTLHSPNFSLGINVLFSWLKSSGILLTQNFSPFIMEQHHPKKKDAPSGTAKRLATSIKPNADIPTFSMRGGDLYSGHRVLFTGLGESLEIAHQAYDPSIFARGSLVCAALLGGKEPGWYEISELLLSGGG